MFGNAHLNRRVTYHSFLTPQHLVRDSLFANPKFDSLLSNIERTANCIIRTKPMVSDPADSESRKISGFWLTEIYYHQLYGKHEIAMRMIDSYVKELSQISSYSQNRTALKTTRGFFQIEDQDILNQMDNTEQIHKIEEIRSTDFDLLDNEVAYPMMKHINSSIDIRITNEAAEKALMSGEKDSISQ